MMTNAKKEFIKEAKGKTVLCAKIAHGYYGYGLPDDRKKYHLPCGYGKAEYKAFLQSLNFAYDAGYGTQELHGTIWYTDGTYSDRYVYDGAECWEYRKAPVIPEYLKKGER